MAATSQDQLDMHFNGNKHKKAEKAAGGTAGPGAGAWKSPTPTAVSIPPPGVCMNSLLYWLHFTSIRMTVVMIILVVLH